MKIELEEIENGWTVTIRGGLIPRTIYARNAGIALGIVETALSK